MLLRVEAFLMLLFINSFLVSAQADDKYRFGGYIKHMDIVSMLSKDSLLSSALIHNRLNFKWFASENFSSSLEIRNRLFYGEQIKYNHLLAPVLDADNGLVDMAFLLSDEKAYKYVINVDRAYLRWNKNNWDMQLGRQRINWGISLVWNPNDIFNAASFVDFDYEERAGTDALRIQYKTAALSGFEVVASPGKKNQKSIYGLMYRFNKYKYDIQLFSAFYFKDVALGAGWAGNIKKMGFKGEFTAFKPYWNLFDNKASFHAGLSMDYTIKGSNYFNLSYLYNSHGSRAISQVKNITALYVSDAKNLSPARHSAFFQFSRAFNPLFTASMSNIYLFELKQLFFMPNLSYSISDNWDINIIAQSLFTTNGLFKQDVTTLYGRLRFSF